MRERPRAARDPDGARRLPVDQRADPARRPPKEQRDAAYELLTDIPGVSCVEPKGALYVFPRLDPEVYPIKDDQQFVLELLRAKKILVTHGTGFNWFAQTTSGS